MAAFQKSNPLQYHCESDRLFRHQRVEFESMAKPLNEKRDSIFRNPSTNRHIDRIPIHLYRNSKRWGQTKVGLCLAHMLLQGCSGYTLPTPLKGGVYFSNKIRSKLSFTFWAQSSGVLPVVYSNALVSPLFIGGFIRPNSGYFSRDSLSEKSHSRPCL